MNPKTDPNSHIYWYAKLTYKYGGDIMKDLQILLGERSNCEPKFITYEDIQCVLTGIVWPLIKGRFQFEEFLNDLTPENNWKVGGSDTDPYSVRVINKCLSVIRITSVSDLGNEAWAKPDPNLLPLRSPK